MIRWARHIDRIGANKILGGKPEGKRTHGSLRRRLEDNIRTDLNEIGWEIVNWIYLTQDRDK
jgi:hypothetical protein